LPHHSFVFASGSDKTREVSVQWREVFGTCGVEWGKLVLFLKGEEGFESLVEYSFCLRGRKTLYVPRMSFEVKFLIGPERVWFSREFVDVVSKSLESFKNTL